MTRKVAELPHIEDATFAACLAPLFETLPRTAEAETEIPALRRDEARQPVHLRLNAAARPQAPAPAGDAVRLPDALAPGQTADTAVVPPSLAEWRCLADQEFAEFRLIALFLAKTDAELAAAAQAYPRQIFGLLTRLSQLHLRRTEQDQSTSALMARLHAAILRASTERV